jgi:hypothetical protein
MTYRMPKGGHYWHLVEPCHSAALCGHVPAIVRRARLSWREVWLYQHRSTPSVDITCPRCLQQLRGTSPAAPADDPAPAPR